MHKNSSQLLPYGSLAQGQSKLLTKLEKEN